MTHKEILSGERLETFMAAYRASSCDATIAEKLTAQGWNVSGKTIHDYRRHLKLPLARRQAEVTISDTPNENLTIPNEKPTRLVAMVHPPEADYVVSVGSSPVATMTEQDFLTGKNGATMRPAEEEDYSPPFRDPIEYGKTLYDQAMARSDKDLAFRRANPHDLVVRNIRTDAPILVTNLSDLHLENKFCDRRRALEDIRLIRDTEGAFALFGGDGIDNFIKHQSAMISAECTPAQAFAMLEYYLSEGGGKVIGGISGNHEFWSKGFAGIDYLTQIFGRLRIAYSPHRLRIRLKVNAHEYRIELRHSYRFKSSINLSNQFLRMWEHSDWEWDMGMVGHTHDGPFVVPFTRHSGERWGGLAGSYKVFDDHSEQWGFNASYPSSPAFVLFPRHKEVVAFKDLRRGIATLKAIRESGDY